MAAEYRSVTVAPGHKLSLRRARQQSGRPGFVTVTGRRCAPYDVKAPLWNEAPIV